MTSAYLDDLALRAHRINSAVKTPAERFDASPVHKLLGVVSIVVLLVVVL